MRDWVFSVEMEKNWTQSLYWNLYSKKETFCTRGRCVHGHCAFSVEREKFLSQNFNLNFYNSFRLKCPFWSQKFRLRHSKLALLFCRLYVFSAFPWLHQEVAEFNGRLKVCRWICRELLCRGGTNYSQVTSVASGTSCGPVWGDTTTALLMVKQSTAGLCFAWWANSITGGVLGTSFPLSGQDLRCDQNQMTWCSNPSWTRFAEPL